MKGKKHYICLASFAKIRSGKVALPWVIALVLLLSVAPTMQAYAAPGDLDPTFSGDGRRTTDFDNARDEAHAVAVQPDGKIVAAGRAEINGDKDFALARYNSNGSLDNSFAGNGKAAVDFSPVPYILDEAYAVVIQPNGKIIAAGTSLPDAALARLNSDGTRDTTFGGDGKVTTSWQNSMAFFRALALQPDGKIVAAGYIDDYTNIKTLIVARYNPDGSLDTSFSGNGKVSLSQFGEGYSTAFAVAVQPDGKIVVAGSGSNNNSLDFALVRLNASGSLDTSFHGDGKVTTDFRGGTDQAYAMVLQPDGKIVVAGSSYSSSGNDSRFALARYTSQGDLDSTFGLGGKSGTDFYGRDAFAYAVALQTDGKIVAGGYAQGDITYDVYLDDDFALARYFANGFPDPSFGGGARTTTDFLTGNDDQVYAMALQPDGKIVAAGRTYVASPYSNASVNFALARYQIAP